MERMAQMFESDYLERTYPSILRDASVAFSEIVANSWDAGATEVRITIPDKIGGEISIQDNGSGMTNEEFYSRWMTMAYNRVAHQGIHIESDREKGRSGRLAYGRNGVGRHAMFCFSDEYTVETSKGGKCNRYSVALVRDGTAAFTAIPIEAIPSDVSGTRLVTSVNKHLPKVSELKRSLSSRFLYDPEFLIFINDELVECQRYVYIKREVDINVQGNIAKVSIYEISEDERGTASTGVAFWVGKKLVGNPDWTINGEKIEDARRKFAKGHIIVCQVDFLAEDIRYDWAEFSSSDLVAKTLKAIADFIHSYRKEYYSGKTTEVREEVIRKNLNEIDELSLSSRSDLRIFFDTYLEKRPEVDVDELNSLIQVLIDVLKTGKGFSLLNRVACMEDEEIDALDDILSQWSVLDIKTVLDEIDMRIKVVKAIEDLCGKRSTDELHTLHPLVTQARWLFGIEYDSLSYTSNNALSTVMREFFSNKRKIDVSINWGKRPDLVVAPDFSLGATCVEEYDENEIQRISRILIIELKKGEFEIKRSEMNQAEEYVDSIYHGNTLNAKPKIKAYVVGNNISPAIGRHKTLKDDNDIIYGEVYAYTYMQLVETAGRRLFNLRKKLQERYIEMNPDDYIQSILGESRQVKLLGA